MKHILIVLSFLFSVNVFAAKEVQNGGGGTKQDGDYQTFGTARITVNKVPLAYAAVPGLSLLNEKLLALPVPENVKADLVAAVIPSFSRRYHQISEDKFDPETRRNLTKIYSELLKVPTSEVVIFAVTEPLTKRTMLLPEFFRLTEVEQAAVLLHEALWIVNKSATYEQIISIEQSAQTYFSERTCPENLIQLLYNLGRFVDEPFLPVIPAIMMQARPASLRDANWSPVRVRLEMFLGGPEVMARIICNTTEAVCASPYPYPIDLRNVMRLRAAQNPESLFYIVMSDFMQETHLVHIEMNEVLRGHTSVLEYHQSLYVELSLAGAKDRYFNVIDGNRKVVGTLRVD
jgi:hypothetical protein